VSTRSQPRTRALGGAWPASARRGSVLDQTEEVALVAHAARRRLLSFHRAWLRFEDLEDCYSQATFELVAQAARGELRCASRSHLRSMLELRFVSRVRDRRRALRGRSPAQAMLDGALALGGTGDAAAEVADPRADIERRALLRCDLRRLQHAAQALSPDQRLVLACQVALQMEAGEFCRTFGWSHEKHRKVYRSGARPISEIVADNPLAQDYVRWGAPGPGRWVTIYATTSPTDHVFVVIAGLRLDTSHNGTDIGPNRSEDGPRWRLLDHIPTWAHWSVRHPPGL
jgi:DNA-directed RNA polymerase specialized sigma24 family protein